MLHRLHSNTKLEISSVWTTPLPKPVHGSGGNFDIHSHAKMVSLCQARKPTLMGNGHPFGCLLIWIRQLFASGTHGMKSVRGSPNFDMTPFIKYNQSLTGGGSIICA